MPWARRDYVIPALRSSMHALDCLRYSVLRAVSQAQLPAHQFFSPRVSLSLWWGDTATQQLLQPTAAGAVGAPVSLQRDAKSGFMHITAQSLTDAVYAQGYVHAGEQITHIESVRRTAAGTQAELYGRGYLSTDRTYRTLGLRKLARQDWERLVAAAASEAEEPKQGAARSSSARQQVAVLRAYTAGVNAGIALYAGEHRWWAPLDLWATVARDARAEVPSVAELLHEWHPIDTLSIMRLQALVSGSQGWEQEHTRALLHRAMGPEAAAVLESFASIDTNTSTATSASSTGGSVWAGTTGEAGEPSVVLDSHSAAGVFGQYLVGLKWDVGSVQGASQPGVPLVWAGSNGMTAWATVGSGEDTEDVFKVRTRTKTHIPAVNAKAGAEAEAEPGADVTAPTEVWYGGAWRETEERDEMITATKAGRDRRGSREWFTVVDTPIGPVVSNLTSASLPALTLGSEEETGYTVKEQLVLSSQALQQPVDLSYLLQLSTASSAQDLHAAAASQRAASLHLVYAVAGYGVGRATTGSPVQRAKGHDGQVPVSGASSATVWRATGMVQESPLPADVHGPYLVLDGKVSSRPSSTASNATDSAPPCFSDVHSALSVQLRDALLQSQCLHPENLRVNSNADERRLLKQARDILQHYDGTYSMDAIGPTVLESVLESLMPRLLEAGTKSLGGVLRGGHLTLLRRDVPQVALLPTRQWLLSLLSPKASALRDNPTTLSAVAKLLELDEKGGPKATYAALRKTVDSAVRSAVLDALQWLVAEYGDNRSYKNKAWRWGHVHRCTASHPAQYHSVLKALFSGAETPCAGGPDSMLSASPGFQFGNNHLKSRVMSDTDPLHARNYRSSLRLSLSPGTYDVPDAAASSNGQSTQPGSASYSDHRPIPPLSEGLPLGLRQVSPVSLLLTPSPLLTGDQEEAGVGEL